MGMIPVLVYDDRCVLCIRFAKLVNAVSGGKFSMVGHYSALGEQLRDEVLDSSARDMFWLIDKKTAYGGRAALLPLLRAVISGGPDRKSPPINESCDAGCKTARAVFLRSASLITNSKKIPL